MNNLNNEIIVFDNLSNKFNIYDFDLKFKESKDVKKVIDIYKMVINEKNNHIYAIDSYFNKLFHLDQRLELEELNINYASDLKVLNNRLYLLHPDINTGEIGSFISVYSENKNNNLELNKTILFSSSFNLTCSSFYVNEDYILLIGKYKTKWTYFNNHSQYVFFVNKDGILLQKTIIDHSNCILKFIVLSEKTIFCETNSSNGYFNLSKINFKSD